MYHPPDYIDNTSEERRLQVVLQRLLMEWQERELDIASGFFEPKVWQMLGSALGGLERFRLLLGKPPEVTNEDAGDGAIDLRAFYRDRLRGSLEDLPLTRDYAHLIDGLTAFLRRASVDVRYYTRDFLHAKAYLMPHIAIVGSSNFTPSGMTRRAELNVTKRDESAVRDLREVWFEAMWAEGTDRKADLIDLLEESKFGGAQWQPFDVFIKVLYEYFKDRLTPEALEARLGVELASFQQEGLREAIRLIDRHGGVIISDAVGLGKTYIGMGLLEHYVLGKRQKGKIPKGLVICPAQLRDLVWLPKLNEYGIKAEVISQESVSRADFDYKQFNGYDVVLIDESHNFRNPGANRYSNLLKLLATGKEDKHVILMTATPVNNSIWDLYHQVTFLTRGSDTFFREYGIRNLKGFFSGVKEGSGDMYPLLEQIMVRRTRQDVKRRQEAGEVITLPGKGEIRFPERRLHSVNYDLSATYDGFYQQIVTYIESLKLVSFNIDVFRKGEATPEVQKSRQSSEALIGILKTLYLKRLESSLQAFEISIRRQQAFQERFVGMVITDGRLLDAASNRKLIALEAEDDVSEADVLELIESLPEVEPTDYDLRAIRREAELDSKTLQKILDLVTLAQRLPDESQRDGKLAEVKALLGGDLAGRKVLIFSYYRDTAQYVYDRLCADTTWHGDWTRPPVIEVIHGDTKPDRRENLVKRFAPVANTVEGEASPIKEGQPEIDILISTDVLSEGQNLQDAGVIINYDLHWTPIRMIQRAGRIDRLGTAFPELAIYNCFPQAGLEQLLGLVERLQDRIRQIDSTVGLDASVLGETISTRSLDQLRKLRGGDAGILEELERDNELVSTDEMKLPLMLYLQQVGLERIRAIPCGIGSGMEKTQRRSGVFFAFQARDQHFWRLYTDDGETITDKRKLFQYLFVDQAEKRVMPSGFEVYDLLERATEDVLREINSAIQSRRIKPPMGQINLELQTALTQSTLFSSDDPDPDAERRDRVLNVVRTAALDPFKRDKAFKAIRARYKETQEQAELVSTLDAFFVENELYRDVVVAPKSPLEQIKAEDLRLIAYEVFG